MAREAKDVGLSEDRTNAWMVNMQVRAQALPKPRKYRLSSPPVQHKIAIALR